jgi:hypothetical protein
MISSNAILPQKIMPIYQEIDLVKKSHLDHQEQQMYYQYQTSTDETAPLRGEKV